MDPTILGGAATGPLLLHCIPEHAVGAPVDRLFRPVRTSGWKHQPRSFRRGIRSDLFAGGTDRRAGRLPPFSPATNPCEPAALVGRLARCRSRLDGDRRAEDNGRLVSRLLCLPAGRRFQGCFRSDTDVSERFPRDAGITRDGAWPYRHLCGHLPAEDQRHKQLCRLDRLVELLFTAYPQPSRSRCLAGVQCHARPAADGVRRLQGSGTDIGALLHPCGFLDGRDRRRSRDQQASGPVAAIDRVQTCASL
ncbi:hypothetical protein D3C73_575350 [compost metagenome]